SMGTISSRKCREVVKNTENVIAIELLCGAQALDLFTNVKPGEGTLAAYTIIRNAVSHLEKDRILSKDINTIKQLMRSGKILEAVENEVGRLQ
ncbi:MAG: aromatic amino acid lyase, partial [Anaerolineales bacterium]